MTVPAFDDPGAWAYCEYCAFQVAYDNELGILLGHERMYHPSGLTQRCYGGGTEPTEQPGPEAKLTPTPYVEED